MSYILDALKKSESERQQQHLPGFADIPRAAQTRSTPVWIWLLVALLLINIVVLAVLLVDREPKAGIQQLELQVPAAASATEPAFRDLVNEAREQVPPEPITPPRSTASSRSALPAANSTTTNARPIAQVPPTSAPTRASSATAATQSIPTMMELQISGELQLPELHLDIHVYSQSADERFVFVNMSKYREQARLTEGPLVKEIRTDGVVLEHRGREFLLPRE
ncbi:MAG: general secretion pathway protein GspB [Woeseia sp.]